MSACIVRPLETEDIYTSKLHSLLVAATESGLPGFSRLSESYRKCEPGADKAFVAEDPATNDFIGLSFTLHKDRFFYYDIDKQSIGNLGEVTYFNTVFVKPEHRGKGVHGAMFRCRVEHSPKHLPMVACPRAADDPLPVNKECWQFSIPTPNFNSYSLVKPLIDTRVVINDLGGTHVFNRAIEHGFERVGIDPYDNGYVMVLCPCT